MNIAPLISDLPPPVKVLFQYDGIDSRVAYLFCLNAHITAICTSKNKPRLKSDLKLKYVANMTVFTAGVVAN